MTQTRPLGTALDGDRPVVADLDGMRRGFDLSYAVLAVVFLAAVIVQFFLAGYGAFAHHQGAHVVHHAFAPHEELGNILGIVSVVLFVLALVARAGRGVLLRAFFLALLTEPVQHALAQFGHDHRWVGGLHVVNAMLILGLTAWVAVDGYRRRLQSRDAR